jgi:hypothetical protein
LTLVATILSAPAHGTLAADANGDGGFTYTPATGYCGTDSFTYQAADGAATSALATVTITVNPLPSLVDVQSGPLAADGTVTFTATASDQFGNLLSPQPQFTWTLTGGGALSSSGVFTPPYNTGSATITASITTSSGKLSGQETIAYPGAAQLNSGGSVSWNGSGVWKSTSASTVIAAPGIRGVTGDLADFANGTGGAIALNGASPLVAGIAFADTGSYTITPGTGGTLHLNNGADVATVNVAAAAAQTISAPLALDSNLAITVAKGGFLTLSGPFSGNGHSLSVSGLGTVVLSGAGESGLASTTVTSGTLRIDDSSVLADGGSLTVGDASAFETLTPALSMNAAVAIAGGDASPASAPLGNTSTALLVSKAVSAMPVSTEGALKTAPLRVAWQGGPGRSPWPAAPGPRPALPHY